MNQFVLAKIPLWYRQFICLSNCTTVQFYSNDLWEIVGVLSYQREVNEVLGNHEVPPRVIISIGGTARIIGAHLPIVN